MKQNKLITIDLAKNTFQVCCINKNKHTLYNKAISRHKLKELLINTPPCTIAMEACGSAHYWVWFAEKQGHEVMLIPPHYVTPYRQGHKTDANDALAIAHAALAPNVRLVPPKDPTRLEFQAMHRVRSGLIEERTRLSNQIRGLLYEFGVIIPRGFAALKKSIPDILEDAENGLSMSFRQVIDDLKRDFDNVNCRIKQLDQMISEKIKTLPACKELMKLEGVGPVGASMLYIALGDGAVFKNGRAAAAYVGVTPKQHSSGGKVSLIGIGKTGQCKLRSVLIQGALACVKASLKKDDPKSRWIQGLVARGSLKKASVALANKTVRTAWALLAKNESYQPVI